eukprot:CAMPEP_0115378096 /NCGR_PEP_ID=MMETSP0271-20121206/3838_1 /TAXON_ID=71861 /ORGANISM="Scrippsiella trochoidea, Strain CCMP3099" /LENGTH=169 /DNA_ID=CAMNT_0002801253 /DNA_START=32 /DNA_END=536 /DNA_ORIENTATION=-
MAESIGAVRVDMKKIEKLLAITMDTATKSVPWPSKNIPSVQEQAQDLLQRHCGDLGAALAEATRMEDDASWWEKLPDVLIQQVPIVGCSTLLLRELWRNIRRCALIAHLYGHDTRSSETQALILTCLIGGGGGGGGDPGGSGGGGGGSDRAKALTRGGTVGTSADMMAG